MDNFGTNVNTAFAGNVLTEFYAASVADSITNRNYEAVMRSETSLTAKILTLEVPDSQAYTGSALTADTPQETETTFTADQKRIYYYTIDDLAKFESYANNPESSLVQEQKNKLLEEIDAYILGFWEDAASGNWIGTSYTTGTVTITTGTGAVAGDGTTFTAAMVGKPFKAAGHTAWYRVKSYASSTSIVIEDDKDDIATAYTGGTINAGATYEIQANTVLALVKTTIFDAVARLNEVLDDAKVPASDRWVVVPPRFARILKQAPEVIPAVSSAYEDVIKKGIIGYLDGMQIFKSTLVEGNNTTGYHVLAGHKSAITMAEPFMRSGVEDLTNSASGGLFGKKYKVLTIFGAKVADVKRKALAHLFCTAALS